MTHSVTTGSTLSEQTAFSAIFRDWLEGHEELGSAAGEWSRFTSAAVGMRIAPAWAGRDWSDPWWEEFKTFLPDVKSVVRCNKNFELLSNGQADVVITGQQPAVMGGPLYTLYKIASTIEAARWRCEVGQPTVPIYWLGDDDQDVVEAMSGRIYDPLRRCFLSISDINLDEASMVGAIPARVWDRGMLNWLDSRSTTNLLAGSLKKIWQESISAGDSTSRMFKKFILRLFPDSGLLIVSGNDSRLHRLAQPVYKVVLPRLDSLREAVHNRGLKLVDSGWHAQISDRSLDNPLYQAQGHRRLKIAGSTQALGASANLRPGVMLRSLIQDWLFRPLATVVGPSELAYHMQLEPLYSELGITHPALLPRLFATVTTTLRTSLEEEERPTPYALQLLAAGALEGAETEISNCLGEALELEDAEARNRVKPLLELLKNRVAGFLERQYDRAYLENRKDQEPWLAPFGKRQERVMSTGWATTLWGDNLLHNVNLAAYVHYKRGAAGQWLDMMMKLDEAPLTRPRQ